MKKPLITLTLVAFFFSHTPLRAQEEACVPDEAEVFYTDEDDMLFNKGKFVGKETDAYLRARRIERNKNWAVALGTTALGVAALVLVGSNHKKEELEKKLQQGQLP